MIIGRASEFLAAYILELSGLRTIHVDLPYDDLWCSHPDDGALIRVQVKSCSTPRRQFNGQGRETRRRYSYPTSNGKKYGGVFLFMALDRRLMIARTWDDVPPQTFRVSPEDFTHEAQVASIKREFNL